MRCFILCLHLAFTFFSLPYVVTLFSTRRKIETYLVYTFHMSSHSSDSEIEIAADANIETLLPNKSRKKYEREYLFVKY